MLYHIEGTVAELEPNLAVIDCGGVGFALNVTPNTVAGLRLGAKAKLYTAESIGENNFDLFGFYTKSEKKLFDMLVSVSGIGPKAALAILSCCTPESFALAVMNNDEKALTAAPGIGKKTAQRVILELRDKISKEMSTQEIQIPVMPVAVSGRSEANDAMKALGVLGYSSAEVAAALKSVDVTGMSAEQIIKAVLRQMVK